MAHIVSSMRRRRFEFGLRLHLRRRRTSHARSAASRVVGASARARAPPMDYLYDLRRASRRS